MSRATDTECPRCLGPISNFEGDIGGSSRIVVDRGVAICGPCTVDEAVRDATGLPPVAFDEWPMAVTNLTWDDVPRRLS